MRRVCLPPAAESSRISRNTLKRYVKALSISSKASDELKEIMLYILSEMG